MKGKSIFTMFLIGLFFSGRFQAAMEVSFQILTFLFSLTLQEWAYPLHALLIKQALFLLQCSNFLHVKAFLHAKQYIRVFGFSLDHLKFLVGS